MKTWKFGIGDIVKHVASDHLVSKGVSEDKTVRISWMGARGVRYIVLETRAQTCHGGTQYFYQCRLVNSDGAVGDRVVDFAEFELVPFTPIEDKVEPLL